MNPTVGKYVKFVDEKATSTYGKTVSLYGYGYDFFQNRLVSFKRDPAGQLLQLRQSYNIHGKEVYHTEIVNVYKRILDKMTARFQRPQAQTQPSQREVTSQTLADYAPPYEYVMFSVPNRCSQYFFAGTTIHQALDLFKRRNELIKASDIQILNVITGEVLKVKEETRTVYVLK